MPVCRDCNDRIDTLAAHGGGPLHVQWSCPECGLHVVRCQPAPLGHVITANIAGFAAIVAVVATIFFLTNLALRH